MERYIGLDAHGSSCTLGVIGPSGRKLRKDVMETNGAALVKYLQSIPGRKHLCLEVRRNYKLRNRANVR